MKPTRIQRPEAFTQIELMVVIGVVLLLVVMLSQMYMPPSAKAKAVRIGCINNLKQIGTAYRIWSNDHGDQFPALQTERMGGWKELLKMPNEGFMCWINYSIMSNELGLSAKLLVCPSDERKQADTFSNFLSNANLSYFVGVGASNNYPSSLLGGDRNLSAGTLPGIDYGFSPENGQGNDVAIQTNSRTGPVCWSLKMHSDEKGNILLGDGSAQTVRAELFRQSWQPNCGGQSNWPVGCVPSSPSFRVLFP